MRGHRLAAAVLFGAVALPSAALADWGYSQWGWSPAEVAQASRGKARVVAPVRAENIGQLERLVVAEHKADGRTYDAQFYFGPVSGLELVRLQPKDLKTCPAIKAELIARYGQPKNAMFPRWWDSKTANAVRYNEALQGVCYVVYGK